VANSWHSETRHTQPHDWLIGQEPIGVTSPDLPQPPVHPLLTGPRLLRPSGISSTSHTQQLQLFNGTSNNPSKMSRYTIKDNSNCFNTTNSLTVQNYLSIADDRSQLLTWLSPLDPGLRHWDIQERRVKDVGEWLIQTEEFRRWGGLGGEGEGEGEADKGVLFCYGHPGAGKTFIR